MSKRLEVDNRGNMPSKITVPEGTCVPFCPFGSCRLRRPSCPQGSTVPGRKGRVNESGRPCPLRENKVQCRSGVRDHLSSKFMLVCQGAGCYKNKENERNILREREEVSHLSTAEWPV